MQGVGGAGEGDDASGAGRSRRRQEDLVDVGVPEELEKADDAQVQEEAGGDWKTL